MLLSRLLLVNGLRLMQLNLRRMNVSMADAFLIGSTFGIVSFVQSTYFAMWCETMTPVGADLGSHGDPLSSP